MWEEKTINDNGHVLIKVTFNESMVKMCKLGEEKEVTAQMKATIAKKASESLGVKSL